MRLRPAQALCLEPAQVRALRAPRFGAGAAQAGFWAVRGQRTPSRIFRITLERGGFWGIKFPQSATNLFRACASQLLAARGRVFRNGGRDSRRLRGGPSLSAFEVQRLEPSSPISGATSVELVSRPVRPALCMPPRSPWPLGHVRFNPTLPGGSPGHQRLGVRVLAAPYCPGSPQGELTGARVHKCSYPLSPPYTATLCGRC